MVTLQRLQASLHAYVKYLVEHPNTSLELRYKGKAYQLHIDPIEKKVPARVNKQVKLKIQEGTCDDCGKVAVNGVCLSGC